MIDAFDRDVKDAVVRRVRSRMDARAHPRPEAACLDWAALTVQELSRHGERCLLQAGSLYWPCAAQDDGVSPTHFGYLWEARSATTRERLALGLLPEIHVWAALPDRREIVDLTTRYLPQQARSCAGLEWTAPPPPDYLWCDLGSLPDGVQYRADLTAVGAALYLLRRGLLAA